jgi:hypothetical protein
MSLKTLGPIGPRGVGERVKSDFSFLGGRTVKKKKVLKVLEDGWCKLETINSSSFESAEGTSYYNWACMPNLKNIV